MNVEYRFVDYGTILAPEPGTLVLDVGMATVPGVIDHHQPDAEPECAASLVVKHPRLVLDHLTGPDLAGLRIVTHHLPDFDAVAAVFLALRLLERQAVDEAMRALAAYARLADSASLPKTIELAEAPYAVLRALSAGMPGTLGEISLARIREGLKFMAHLAARAAAGAPLLDGGGLFRGIDRYERAVRRCREDYLAYLRDVDRGRKERLRLPAAAGTGRREVDGLIVRGPTSFLLKEWARRDRENARLGRGFSFLMTGFGHRRIVLGVDPESGVNLRGLAPRLDAREMERRAAEGRPMVPWYPGDAPLFGGRIIDSPRDGTSLPFDEVLEEVLAFGRG